MKYCIKCGNKLIDTARFCSKCGSEQENIETEDEYTVTPPKEKQSNRRNKNTCPSCGSPISSFNAECPYCGCEIVDKTRNSACKELCDKLEKIDRARLRAKQSNGIQDILLHSISAYEKRGVVGYIKQGFSTFKLDDYDSQKVDLINNFFIPNTKADIMECLFLAESRIKTCKKFHSMDLKACFVQRKLGEAWGEMLQHAIKKGKMLLADDTDFRTFYKSYKRQKYREEGRCQYCGGEFDNEDSLLGNYEIRCTYCGRIKDYDEDDED